MSLNVFSFFLPSKVISAQERNKNAPMKSEPFFWSAWLLLFWSKCMTAFKPYRVSNDFLLGSNVWRVCIFCYQLRSASQVTHFGFVFCFGESIEFVKYSDVVWCSRFDWIWVPCDSVWSPNRCLITLCNHTATETVENKTTGKTSIKRLPSDLRLSFNPFSLETKKERSGVKSKEFYADSMPHIHLIFTALDTGIRYNDRGFFSKKITTKILIFRLNYKKFRA